MATYREASSNALREAWCQMAAPAAVFHGYVNEFLRDVGVGQPPYTFNNLYRSFCSREPPAPAPDIYPQGQCLVHYGVSITYLVSNNGGASFETKVEGLACSPSGAGIYGAVGTPFLLNEGGFFAWYVDAYDSTGTPTRWGLSTGYSTAIFTPGELLDYSVVRCDGLPDDCGTPAPEPPPPNYWIQPITFTYTDNSTNTDIDVIGDVDFSVPYFDINGEINIDARIVFDDPVLEINAEANFTINLDRDTINPSPAKDVGKDNRGGKNTDKNPTEDPEEEPEPDDDLPEPSPPPNPAATRIIVGAIVYVSAGQTGTATQIGQDENPDIYAPSLAEVSFRCLVNATQSVWTNDIPVKNRAALIPCPWYQGAVDVKGTARPGVEIKVIPVYDERNFSPRRPDEE